MFIKHNYLKWYRKQSILSQNDVAFILDLKDFSCVSRWEQGQKRPSLYTLLYYQLLFDIPIEVMFARQREHLVRDISKRIRLRLEFLKTQMPDKKAARRMEFLEATLKRLTAPPAENK